ncbi:MAG: hypothetical protein JXA73_05695 [Acidobacteria bacterium]|nr:hypothetical protein [Acidobacteriota bacterium]
MRTETSAGLFLACLAVIAIAPVSVSAQTQGSSPSQAAPAGVTLTGIVECGEGYTSHELYDIKLTLIEVIRGEEAWALIKKADSGNKPAEPGAEYLLARIRFEYFARGTPGLCVHQVVPEQFTAYSAGGEDYKSASVVLPKPEMRKGFKSGESLEGWIAFMVAQNDRAPLMSYSASTGGAVQQGGDKWFLLR